VDRPFPFSILLLLSLFFSTQAQAEPAALRLEETRHYATGHLSLLRDPTGRLGIEAISSAAQAARFTPLPGNLAQGFTRDALWLKIPLLRAPDAPAEWWMEIQSALYDEVEVYVPRPGGGFERHRAGDAFPASSWEFRHTTPVFRLILPAGEATTLYLRIRTVNTTASGITFWQPQAFSESAADAHWGFGLYYGICLALFFANLFFWGITRDRLFGLYALFSLMVTLTSTGSEGFLPQYLYPDWGGVNDYIVGVTIALALPTGCIFLARALRMEAHYPRFRKLYVGGGVLAGSAGALGVLLGFYTEVIPVVQGVILLYLPIPMVVAALLSLKGERGAQLIFAAYVVFHSGVGIRILRNFGFVQPSFFTDRSFQIGALIYLFLMNVAVGWRYNDLRREKNHAEASLLLAQQEITLKRRTEEEQKRFIAMVSHEFRTPLAIIGATTERLALRAPGQKAAEEAGYAKIQRSVEWLTALLDEYLTEERLELLGQGVRLASAEPAALLASAAERAREMSARHAVTLDSSGLPTSFTLDPDLIKLVLHTLAENAIKHTPPGTQVHLRGTATPDGGIAFEVSDSGPGVAEDELPQVFNKFFRGRQSGQTYGSGLGLFLARNVAHLHGGEISAANRPGGGMVFRVTLPAPGNVIIREN
jgi:signal transduction histidine kinase